MQPLLTLNSQATQKHRTLRRTCKKCGSGCFANFWRKDFARSHGRYAIGSRRCTVLTLRANWLSTTAIPPRALNRRPSAIIVLDKEIRGAPPSHRNNERHTQITFFTSAETRIEQKMAKFLLLTAALLLVAGLGTVSAVKPHGDGACEHLCVSARMEGGYNQVQRMIGESKCKTACKAVVVAIAESTTMPLPTPSCTHTATHLQL
jgi:hypothetical protein